jgi:hypothetical protein
LSNHFFKQASIRALNGDEEAWDDYGEFLLDKAKVKILNPEYSVELHGEPWTSGFLDLS